MASLRMFGFLSFISFICLVLAAPSALTRRDDTVYFTIDLTWGPVSPVGGIARNAILTNGSMPGPVLNAKVGQKVEFTVINNLPNETAVHFHGIAQTGTPYSDGVPGLTQKPIQPGSTFLYKFTVDEAGTYFYHAHYKGQMMDGLYGAIIVAPKDGAQRPFSMISGDSSAQKQMLAAEAKNEPVFISDWTEFTFDEFYAIQEAANIDNACADAIILNGKGSVTCLPRANITAYTAPQLPPLLAAVNPPQLTDKGCLPPNLPATQGNFTFNIATLPPNAYFQCNPSTGPTYTHTVDAADGWAAMTFINSGGFSSLKFTIDNHKLWVYAANGYYITPQQVDQVVVDNGDRMSVMIKLDQAVGQYQIRVANNGLNQIISGNGLLAYKGAAPGLASNSVAVMNYAGINTTAIVPFKMAKAAPFPPIAPAATADVTYSFDIKKMGQPAGAYIWTLSGSKPYSMDNDDKTPLLFQNPGAIPDDANIVRTKYEQWVDLIVKVEGPIAQPHPMHKHANKFFVLGAGTGVFNYSSVAEAAAVMPAGTFNFATPPYVDGYTSIPAEGNSSWMALRYQASHPGAWAFHCHMQTHFSGGMAAVILDAVDNYPTCPNEYASGNGIAVDNSDSMQGSASTTNGTASNITTPYKSTANTVPVSTFPLGMTMGVGLLLAALAL